MKKRDFIVLLMAFFISDSMYAQSFVKGTNIASVGVGFGSTILNYTGASQTPAISLQYEKGVWDVGGPGVISLGGYAGFKGYKYSGKSGTYVWDQKWNYTVIGVRSAYHYNGIKNDKVDVYGGLMLSYNIVNYKYTDNVGNSGLYSTGSYGSGVGLTAYIGGRYFFTDNIAAMAELGYGVSYFTIGASLKF
ncbi:MAG TPA: hypothetical protein VG847_04645 [Chitinophagaceae bacterium]|nr:hypothetical protein [Chitinophagaceae bacterium]